jgi:predicted nicotinamide N-methyase
VTTGTSRTIASYDATLTAVAVGGDVVPLWQVSDLERHVDRQALLAGIDPPEPPYWAHLWSGARVLAEALPAEAGRVCEIGCGLGLPGLVAARRGARVVFVDRQPAPLDFVRASADANGLGAPDVVVADFAALPCGARCDLVLAAEVLYDRTAFAPLARDVARVLAPGGRVLLTDGRRIDTRDFYRALDAAGFVWRAQTVRVLEEGFLADVHLVEARPG